MQCPSIVPSFNLKVLCLMALCLRAGAMNRVADAAPIPLPKSIRIESARPRAVVWQRLTARQKKLVYHLTEAARAGRSLLFYQSHRLSLPIRRMIESSLSKESQAETKALLGAEGFREFLLYSAKFLDQAGPYGGSNRKYILTKVSPDKVDELMRKHVPKLGVSDRRDAARLLTDPAYEVRQYPESTSGDGLETTGGNLYETGLTGAEVRAALASGLNPTLNCRVVRRRGGVGCEIQTVKSPGIAGKALTEVVRELAKARAFASTAHQKGQIDATIRYFKSGKIEDFRKANIEWVRDGANSTVDFVIGWVEVYQDWLARIGSWESYVQIVDPRVSEIARRLASHAQYFEDAMPYGSFKKKFPPKYAPPAIMVYYFQELAESRSGGYNLPNFDDLRRDVGAKNVIRLPLPGEDKDPEIQAMYREALSEFLPKALVEPTLLQREKLWRVLVLLHEIIGHGSGTYDTSKYLADQDPISALGPLGSALEEQRADLTALVFANDPKLIEVGLYRDADEARKVQHALYDYYLADFLRRTSGQRTLTEAHQRGHWLFVNELLGKGAAAWVAKEGGKATPANQVLVVKDYALFQSVARSLLERLQRIKAVRDEKGLQDLFDKHAPLDAIASPWAQAIIRRGEPLRINAGYIEQPWRVTEDGKFQGIGGTTLESIAPFWKGL